MRTIDADALVPDFLVTIPANNILCKRYVSMEQIQNAPTIEPKPKKGRWICDHGVKCSVCGYTVDDPYYVENYCTRCGSFNEKGVDDETN